MSHFYQSGFAGGTLGANVALVGFFRGAINDSSDARFVNACGNASC